LSVSTSSLHEQIFLVIYFYLIMAAAFVALLPAACAAWLFPARCGDYPTCRGSGGLVGGTFVVTT